MKDLKALARVLRYMVCWFGIHTGPDSEECEVCGMGAIDRDGWA